MRQRCGPIQCVSSEDGSAMPKSKKWSNNEAQLPTQQRRSENKIMQTRERTRKRHRNTTKSTVLYVSQHINTPKEPCTMVDTCCCSYIDKDHQRQHVIGTAQDADTETNVRGHRELRHYTWRTDAKEHKSSVSNPLRKSEHT